MTSRLPLIGAWATLTAAVAVSTAANVLASAGHGWVGGGFGAWAPLAFLAVVAHLERVPMINHRRSIARVAGSVIVAAVAAWVSYWHTVSAGLLYGQGWTAAHLLPLSVDGLVLVASMSILDLQDAFRIPQPDQAPRPGPVSRAVAAPTLPPATMAALPNPDPDPPRTDHPSSPGETGAGPANRSRQDEIMAVVAAHPNWSNPEVANEVGCTERTVRRYRPRVDPEDVTTGELVG